MPRFAHIFEAAADTLNAYYQAVAEVNIDSLMGLWIDEEFVSCICADGSHLLANFSEQDEVESYAVDVATGAARKLGAFLLPAGISRDGATILAATNGPDIWVENREPVSRASA